MTDTSVNHEAERWIVETGLSKHFPGTKFAPKKMKLTWGGVFAFDAVSADGRIVVAVSISTRVRASQETSPAKLPNAA